MGRNINTFVNQNQSAGRHFVTWNANDYLGNQVSAGVYLYRLQAGNMIFTRKMVLMK
jgi:flagellar hook assembly protein FlgD